MTTGEARPHYGRNTDTAGQARGEDARTFHGVVAAPKEPWTTSDEDGRRTMVLDDTRTSMRERRRHERAVFVATLFDEGSRLRTGQSCPARDADRAVQMINLHTANLVRPR